MHKLNGTYFTKSQILERLGITYAKLIFSLRKFKIEGEKIGQTEIFSANAFETIEEVVKFEQKKKA